MVWAESIPGYVERAQRAYDRRALVARMREVGLPVKAIAARLGLSRSRVHQLLASHDRACARGRLEPPAMTWAGYIGDDLARMAAFASVRRDAMLRREFRR